ncbi:IPT/TIG domain-containing protein [Agarilytica rhodophyticola]|uniref:IPT/TIG domain-containing protein n=1 Tax=Agarilytica rhodophyticola TaxID=1737490 RepID=UPI000B341AFD|nr:IPT/TIG domain-containing protein [Agarilytica rhodophyticola]
MFKLILYLTIGIAFSCEALDIEGTSIEQVASDGTTLIIQGRGLTYNDNIPEIKISDVQLQICSFCFSNTEITAEMPPSLGNGDYKIKLYSDGIPIATYDYTYTNASRQISYKMLPTSNIACSNAFERLDRYTGNTSGYSFVGSSMVVIANDGSWKYRAIVGDCSPRTNRPTRAWASVPVDNNGDIVRGHWALSQLP